MDFLSISLTAFGLGIFHALEPGHGKTLMAGALVGSTRRWLDPLSLAVSTATGHAVGIVFFVTLSFVIAHELAVDEVRHLVELCAGLIVSLCGIALFCRAVRHRRGARHSDCCSCNHAPPGNKHLPLIGFLIGLVPCPGAIAVSLYATKTDSFMQALLLSLLFALGVAVTLSGLGMLITHSSHKAGGYSGKLASFKHVLPFISPAMINTLGLIMIFHSSTH